MTTATAPTHYPSTANRATLCQLFGFGRTTWQSLTSAENFPAPNGYANRWPTYSVSCVTRWLYDNKPRILLKTDFGRAAYSMINHDKKAVAVGGAAVFAAALNMDEGYEFEAFVEEWAEVEEAQQWTEDGVYWPLGFIYRTAIEYHREELRIAREYQHTAESESLREAFRDNVPDRIARIDELITEAAARGYTIERLSTDK